MSNLDYTIYHQTAIYQNQLSIISHPHYSPPSLPHPPLTHLLTGTIITLILAPHPQRRPFPAVNSGVLLLHDEGFAIPLVGAVVAHPAVGAARAVAVGDAGAN